jgi:hypothetical protein
MQRREIRAASSSSRALLCAKCSHAEQGQGALRELFMDLRRGAAAAGKHACAPHDIQIKGPILSLQHAPGAGNGLGRANLMQLRLRLRDHGSRAAKYEKEAAVCPNVTMKRFAVALVECAGINLHL